MVGTGAKVVIFIAILAVAGGLVYLYEEGFLGFPTGGNAPGSGSGAPSLSSPLSVKSAQLEPPGDLLVDLVNTGQYGQTKTILPLDECAPNYSDCQSLGATASTFVLPPGGEFTVNMTLPGCGFVPDIAPCWGAPITGETYYFQVQVTLQNGATAVIPVKAVAQGTFSYSNQFSAPFQHDTIAVTGVTSFGLTIYGNLSARMSTTITTDNYPSNGATANLINASSYENGVSTQSPLASAAWGCAGFTCPKVIGGGPTSESFVADFSTVTTGVSVGTFYLVTVNISNYGTYYFWVQAQQGS